MNKVLITGGAGFIGTNTALYYRKNNWQVRLFDNFSREGTRKNLESIHAAYPDIEFVEGDIRDSMAVEKALADVDLVFHFAGQVAVTTSVVNPYEDFTANALGTLVVLEAVRKRKNPPIVLYSSTNKVYGGLEGVDVVEDATRYRCPARPEGIDETEPLDFHSPYGCSKGAADQYVRDYARIYNLPTIVFRQSCIYGPHQYGVEDQGWVAWFLIAAKRKEPLTIYGTGKQVRDLLWIDDLIKAFDGAIANIATTRGQIYNIGGGMENSISVWMEFGPMIEKLIKRPLNPKREAERPGDQPFFVANSAKARKDFGWSPTTTTTQGIPALYEWIHANV